MKVSHFYRKKEFDSFNPYFTTVDVEDPETKRLQELVFSPDPETGNPRSDVYYLMSGSGIGLLMGRYKLMRAIGGDVKIVHAGERIRKILMLSGIHKIIPIEGEF